jgi:hypothetical protein
MKSIFSKSFICTFLVAALCSFAPAPKVKSVTFKIFQKGKEVAIDNHICNLKKAPFEIVFEITNATTAEVWTTASFHNDVYKSFKNEDAIDSIAAYENCFPKPAVKGKPAIVAKAKKGSDENQEEEETSAPVEKKDKAKAEKPFVEKPFNEDKLILINGDVCKSWHYKNDNDCSFDKTEKKGSVITCTRSVKAFYVEEEKKKIKLTENSKKLYLTFYSYDFNKAKKTKTDMMRDYVKIIWSE